MSYKYITIGISKMILNPYIYNHNVNDNYLSVCIIVSQVSIHLNNYVSILLFYNNNNNNNNCSLSMCMNHLYLKFQDGLYCMILPYIVNMNNI